MTSIPPSKSKEPALGDAFGSVIRVIWCAMDRDSKRMLAQAIGLMILGSVLGAFVPLVYKIIIDVFGGNGPSASYLTPGVLIAVFALLQLLLSLSTSSRELVHGLATQRMNRRLSNRLFAHIARLPLKFHLERKTGAVGEALNQGLNGSEIVLQHTLFTILPVIIEFLAVVIVLVQLGHSAYLLIIASSAVVYGLTFWRAADVIALPSHVVSAAHMESTATLTDSLLNFETIKYFAGEETICSKYDRTLGVKEGAWRDLSRLKARYESILGVIYTISITVTLGCAGYETLGGRMSIGDFVLVNIYVARLYQPLQTIGLAARDVAQGLAFIRRMLEIMCERPECNGVVSGTANVETVGHLTFENVCFAYRPDRPILRGVSFSIEAGRTVAIVGASGSGKSSIIRLLFRLYEPDSGRILIDGRPITEIALSSLRRSIAIVPQDTVLFNDTLGTNIGFGREGATNEEVERAAQVAHLHTFIAGLADGYLTEVGERGLKLSGGEKQRVSIARAAIKRPAIYVFDEATSSLDSRTEQEILSNIYDVSQSTTTLVIAHRLSTVVAAHTILVLEDGVIVERGTHAQLLATDGSYAALWYAQQERKKPTIPQLPSLASIAGAQSG